MKKILYKLTALLTVFVLSSGMVSYADQPPITVFLNGEQLVFDVQPTLEDGRTLVPMRVIFEALGAQVTWDNETFTAVAVKDNTIIAMTVDDNILFKNGEVTELDVPARLVDGRTLVPVRAVSEGLGADVQWDNETWTVHITTKKEKTYSYTELAPDDKETLKSEYTSFRYLFEQYYLPSYIFGDEGVKASLKSKTKYLGELTDKAWYMTVAGKISSIQTESKNNYSFSNIKSEDEYINNYFKLVDKTGFSPRNIYSYEFVKTKKGNTLFLIEFRNALPSMAVPCKYIAIATDKTGDVHYYTAETDIIETDHFYLCEVFEEGRTTHSIISTTKNAFLNAIDLKLN